MTIDSSQRVLIEWVEQGVLVTGRRKSEICKLTRITESQVKPTSYFHITVVGGYSDTLGDRQKCH